MEFAGVDKSARSKRRGWKMQKWTYRNDVAKVDNAGVGNLKTHVRNSLCSLKQTFSPE